MSERAAKARTTRRSNSERFSGQSIQVDKNWRIARLDDLNWVVYYKGEFDGYFGDIVSALKSLPRKMLGEAAKNSLAGLLETHRAIVATIESTLRMKLA